MNIQAVLFDMDGVVIDTHEAVTRFWEDLAATHGVSLSAADYEAHIYGVPATRTFDLLFPMVTGELRRRVMADLEADELTQQYIPVPGVIDFLHALKRAGIPTALVTSGETWKAKSVFDQLGLHPLFATTVTASDITHGKPAPDCYQLAAKRLAVDPKACLVFEDSLAGASAGLASGAQVIGVQTSPGLVAKLQTLGVRQVVADFQSIKQVLTLEKQTVVLHPSIPAATPDPTPDPAAQVALWADQLRDITAHGHHFASNVYDKENYEAIRQIALEMMALATGDSLAALEPLRDTVFTRFTPFATGDAAIINAKGQILLLRRSDDGKWAMPGGGLSVGETPAQGVVREAFEETGIRCQAVDFVGVFDSRFCETRGRHQLYMFVFLCRPLEEEASQAASHAHETLETRWFAEDELPDELSSGHAIRIPYAFRFWRGEVGAFWDHN